MTTEKARQLLGEVEKQYSDEQILVLIEKIEGLARACADKIERKIKSEGINFLSEVK